MEYSNYRYRLEKEGNKHNCPNLNCGQRTFSMYIDTHNNNSYVHDTVGLCNRRDKCGYHLHPYKYNLQNPGAHSDKAVIIPSGRLHTPQEVQSPTSFIDYGVLKKSLRNYGQNDFVQFLKRLYPVEMVKQLISLYLIGTTTKNRIIFWHIDREYKIRSGKIMSYEKNTGKRSKAGYSISWIHKEARLIPFNFHMCFFGEHLLTKFPDKPVAIFESEKTAIIAANFFRDFVCLGSGGKGGLKEEKITALKGREVYLFPDLQAFEEWTSKAIKYKHIVKMTVSNFLEEHCTQAQRAEGLDLADFLIEYLLKDVKNKNIFNTSTQLARPTQTTSNDDMVLVNMDKEVSSSASSNQDYPTLSVKPDSDAMVCVRTKDAISEKIEVVTVQQQPNYTWLRFSVLGKLRFILRYPYQGLKVVQINLFHLFRLIVSQNQNDIEATFADISSTEHDIYPNKLVDYGQYYDLRKDGYYMLRMATVHAMVYYKTKQKDHYQHNGLLYFSITVKDIGAHNDILLQLKQKTKLLQNVVLVYAVDKSTAWVHDIQLNFMVYFEPVSITAFTQEGYSYLDTTYYNMRCKQYAEYVMQSLETDVQHCIPEFGATLCIDLNAWFNPDPGSFISWQNFLSRLT